MVKARILPQARLPWVVSVHDLLVIKHVLARPEQFLTYLRRRTARDAAQPRLRLFGREVWPHDEAAGLGQTLVARRDAARDLEAGDVAAEIGIDDQDVDPLA